MDDSETRIASGPSDNRLDGWRSWGIAGLVIVLPKLIVAVGEAIGLAVGSAAATAGPWWAMALVSAGVGGTGITLLVNVLVKATREASKEPYEWTVPVLGIGGGLVLDLAKEYSLDNSLLKLVLSAAIAFIVVVAGACYKHGGFRWRFVAIVLILAPPAVVLAHNLDPARRASLAEAFHSVPVAVWFRLVAFLLIGCGVAVLHHLSSKKAPGRT